MLASREHLEPNAHAAVLFLLIDEVMKEARIDFPQLKGVAVSKGPGSYTGLRIGVSAAKGICHATGAALIAVSTLQLMAISSQYPAETSAVIPMIDARRNEVYTGIYSPYGEALQAPHPLILTPDSCADALEKGVVYFIGNGATKWQAQCIHPNARFNPDVAPTALQMGELAMNLYDRQQFEDLAYFEPEYVKPVFITGG
jgi:tRNA threonylcarbamoyladenosine biosynthesis protein TsaB